MKKTKGRLVQLNDEQWALFVAMLSGRRAAIATNRPAIYRDFVNAVLWVLSTRSAWTELPKEFGSSRAVYVRYLRWNERRVWNSLGAVFGEHSAVHREVLRRDGGLTRNRERISRAASKCQENYGKAQGERGNENPRQQYGTRREHDGRHASSPPHAEGIGESDAATQEKRHALCGNGFV
ncbi:transposase [Lysobacter sp. CA196]|uniref:transposase n=1 Tax=Lysobacter sp. CA196 TaxID=3455606 RepID=UPI003F8D3D25